MFERFTDRARAVLVHAQEEARRLHHSYIGTEHILLGLLSQGDGVGGEILTSFGVTLDAVRQEVQRMLGEWESDKENPSALNPAPPFTPRAKKVLELSLREALQLSHSYIGTEHILLGILREGEGVAAQALTGLGVDLVAVRQRVIATISGSGQRPIERIGAVTGTIPMPQFTRVERTSTEPRCPRCRAELSEGARFRTILVQPDAESDDTSPLRTYIIYCGKCGASLHLFTSDT